MRYTSTARRVFQWLAITVLLAMAAPAIPAQAAPLDYAVAGGHFYAQANGQGGGGGLGYVISNDEGIAFWTEFRRLGGVYALGYPVSHRFEWRGTVVQVLQKAVIQWQPAAQRAAFVNIFDELGVAGKDDWLKSARSIPKQVWLPDEGKLSWPEVVRGRQAFLDPFPAIKARYFAVRDPLGTYGLPSSRVEDAGPFYVVRLQRAVIQQWKIDTPWARAGQVTVANGGDLAKEAGLFPQAVVSPQSPSGILVANSVPPARGRMVIALDPGHGGSEIGAQFAFRDGLTLYEKNVNLQIALKAADILRRAGYEVVLTRTADAGVNAAGQDLNSNRSVNVEDDLQARVDIANATGAAVLVSVHHNGNSASWLSGTEVYYDPDRPFAGQSRRLAQYLQLNLLQALRGAGYNSVDRGVKTDRSVLGGGHYFLLGPRNRYVARPSQMAGAIGEALFLTNPTDAAQLRRPEVIDALALGYASGIAQYMATR